MALRPGEAVRGSTTGRPIMVLLDYLGRRGSLRVAWELRDGAVPFRELQRRSELTSPNVMTRRLKEGVELGLIERGDDGYALTRDGRGLFDILNPLERWSTGWARRRSRG